MRTANLLMLKRARCREDKLAIYAPTWPLMVTIPDITALEDIQAKIRIKHLHEDSYE